MAEMVQFFGFYYGVPMRSDSPPETLLRAADAAERDARYSHKDVAEDMLRAARDMRMCATTR